MKSLLINGKSIKGWLSDCVESHFTICDIIRIFSYVIAITLHCFMLREQAQFETRTLGTIGCGSGLKSQVDSWTRAYGYIGDRKILLRFSINKFCIVLKRNPLAIGNSIECFCTGEWLYKTILLHSLLFQKFFICYHTFPNNQDCSIIFHIVSKKLLHICQLSILFSYILDVSTHFYTF